ncbi:MAG TPA: 1,4-alpha-glucan branching protein domain-containing protein [Myxococcota bacterium]
MSASLVIALHGHLPFIHHPEHEFFLEEDWLFEAVADCYLPILHMFDGWARDGVDAQITMGLSPPLLSMLAEPLLRERTVRALSARVSLARRALHEHSADSPYRAGLQCAVDEAERGLARYDDSGRDLAKAFAEHHVGGRVELMTCGATHGLQPVLLDVPSIRAQVREAVKTHERFLGVRPRGIWLPECGVHPLGLDALAEEDLWFTFCEDRAVRFAWPPPQNDVYRPLWSPEGVAMFPRDPDSAREVWSAEEGYPGDQRYREFYRDLGYDADASWLDDVHKQGTGARKNVGVKVHRITGKVGLNDKLPYDPAAAAAAAEQHAWHFARRRTEDALDVEAAIGAAPCITAAFDAELFGHWWHEGPWFLDRFLRLLASGTVDGRPSPKPVSASTYLTAQPQQQVAHPAVSSWGDGGSFEVWCNKGNDWLHKRLFDAKERLSSAVRAHGGAVSSSVTGRALRQATRELMLAQSSDWPFILTMGTQMGYGVKRPVVHLSRMHRLVAGLERGQIDEADLLQLEARDGVFEDVDVSVFG